MTSARRWVLPLCLRRRTLSDSDRSHSPGGGDKRASDVHGRDTANREIPRLGFGFGFLASA
jgi:hypothetical protein